MRGSDYTDGQNQPTYDPTLGQYVPNTGLNVQDQLNRLVNPHRAQPGRPGHLMPSAAPGSAGVNVRGLANIQRILQGAPQSNLQDRQGIQPSAAPLLQQTYLNGGLQTQSQLGQMSNQHSIPVQGPTLGTGQSGHGIFQIGQSHPSRFQTDQSHASRFQTDQSHSSRVHTDQSQVSDQSRHARFQPDITGPHANHSDGVFSANEPRQRALYMDKSRALESILDLERFLPNLEDQSTVHFPAMAASMAYPSEEAELNEILQRMTDAFPTSDIPTPPGELMILIVLGTDIL